MIEGVLRFPLGIIPTARMLYIFTLVETPTYEFNEDSHPELRTIGVSHKTARMSFKETLRSHSWSAYKLLIIIVASVEK